MTQEDLSGKGRISRRTMLKLMAAGAAGAVVRPADAIAGAQLMRAIPKTGEMLPAIGLGTYQTFDVASSEGQRAPIREVLQRFVELGGKLVDSSPMYGRAEQVIGDLVADLNIQSALFYATKVWTEGEQDGIEQMERSLERFRTSRIDLMQVHNLVDWRTHLGTLRHWKDDGKIRYLGVTHYTVGAYDDLERLIKTQDLDFVQFNYSLDTREAERRLLPVCAEYGVAVLVNRPFEHAGLFGKVRGKPLPPWATEFDCASWAQFFLKYILAHPAVTCVIPATSKPKHLVDNMQAGLGRLPDTATRRKMAALMETL